MDVSEIKMGRKPTVNLNLPPYMRRRKQRSGKVYYYLRSPDAGRTETPLGDDFILALKKYAELNTVDAVPSEILFKDVITKYQMDVLPKLATNTIRVQKSDINHLAAAFNEAPLDQIKPSDIRKLLDKHKDKPTTANRCKRLFSSMWNYARGWGYTDLANPCEGIRGFTLEKRMVYITDEVFNLVHEHGSIPLQDALDLAYLTGQRPADALSMTEHDIVDGHLIVTQFKTKQPLRIVITGKLSDLIDRIHARKALFNRVTSALLVNMHGKRMTPAVLRNHFADAKEAAIKAKPSMEAAIKEFWFYDLRAKAADDTSDDRGEQAASNLLGHDSVRTTQKHYLRRGKIVTPTK